MKSIKEIKEDVAREHGFRDFAMMYYDEEVEIPFSEVAQRYAQQYIDVNKELVAWKESMLKVHSELNLQKVGNALDMMVGTSIAPNILPKILELKQSNKELLNMLEYVYNFSRGMHFHKGSITDQEISNLITKNKQS